MNCRDMQRRLHCLGNCGKRKSVETRGREYTMEIRKTQMSELDEVMEVYKAARKFMASQGNPNQWGNTRPPREQVEKDVAMGKSYVCVENGRIEGVFYFAHEEDPTYKVIENGSWKKDGEYAVAHRVASAGRCKGVGAFCLNWAFEQSGNLRIDTHHDNKPMQNLLNKLGFEYCGIIYLENGEPRLAFQKY